MTDPLFAAAGRLSDLYRSVDWTGTPVGPTEQWSPTLRRSLALVLDTGFPAALFWGPEFALLYNEAFVTLIGDKHPGGLGRPGAVVFEEAWEFVAPRMTSVWNGGEPVWQENASVPLERAGTLQEAFFTFSYSPVRNERGTIEGVLDISAETTRQVIDRRRLTLLDRLRRALADSDELADFSQRILSTLRDDSADLPEVAFRDVPGMSALDEAGLAAIEDPNRPAPLSLGLDEAGGHGPGPTMLVRPSPQLEDDETYMPFLRLVAVTVGQALSRATYRARERALAADERSMSESLQRALLTQPPRGDDEPLIAVRYVPAAVDAEIGGDWHDAFAIPDQGLALVIGDVAGHDRNAAAAMGQVRNLLRGIARTVRGPADEILGELDEAMADLGVNVLATAIVAQLEHGSDRSGATRHMRWSNAGHPPPVHVMPSGEARLLEARPNRLLGLGGHTERSSHDVELKPGGAVVFYTDGLVERRDRDIDEGFRWLCEVLRGQGSRDPEAIADHVLDELGDVPEDDVALLVLAV